MIKCCKDCPNRYRACHDDCDLYISEKKRDEETKRRRARIKFEEDLGYGTHIKKNGHKRSEV